MKKNKKNKGYYKYYNKEGKMCRIKVDDDLRCKTNFNCFVNFKHLNEDYWMIHEPNIKFKDILHIVNFLCKNLETNGIVFKVTSKN